ncbi:HAD family hydrolase [Bacillus cytotoxicus]
MLLFLVGDRKPHPERRIKTCKQLDIRLEELIMGDTVVDVKMAKEAGSIAVGIANDEHGIEELVYYYKLQRYTNLDKKKQ